MYFTAGPRFNFFSIVSLAMLFVFVLAVVTLVIVDILYISSSNFLNILRSPPIKHAIYLSFVTSSISVAIVTLISIPIGYALSRYKFPGSEIIQSIVDIPIILPPVVIGVSLLLFFRTPIGRFIESFEWFKFVYTVKGIVLCQVLVSASYGIGAARTAFDAVDVKLEHLALVLGCSPFQAFRKIVLPMAGKGIAAGAVFVWATAVGIFGPLLVFAGAVRMKTEVMPTTIYLELSVGRIEEALAVSILMIIMGLLALTTLHFIGSKGNRWLK